MNQEKIDLLLYEANFYRENGEYEDAISNLHQIVNAIPNELKYIYLLAGAYFEAQNTDGALKYINEILDKDSKYVDAIHLKGLVFEALKKFDDAEKIYLECLEINSDFLDARFDLIQLYSNIFFPERIPSNKKIFDEPDKVIFHTEFLYSYLQGFDMKLYNKKSKLGKFNFSKIFILSNRLMSIALFEKKEYRKCIENITLGINLAEKFDPKNKKPFFINEKNNLFKLAYLLNDESGMQQYEQRIKEECLLWNADFEENMQLVISEIENGEVHI